MSRVKNSIPINEAKKWAKKWQTENPKHCKAFLIPVIDLIQALEIMEVLVPNGESGNYTLKNADKACVRTYMSIDENTKEGGGEKLLIVGTALDSKNIYRDLIEDEKPLGTADAKINATVAALKTSGVFDFTKPCPSECDVNSPLYNP